MYYYYHKHFIFCFIVLQYILICWGCILAPIQAVAHFDTNINKLLAGAREIWIIHVKIYFWPRGKNKWVLTQILIDSNSGHIKLIIGTGLDVWFRYLLLRKQNFWLYLIGRASCGRRLRAYIYIHIYISKWLLAQPLHDADTLNTIRNSVFLIINIWTRHQDPSQLLV